MTIESSVTPSHTEVQKMSRNDEIKKLPHYLGSSKLSSRCHGFDLLKSLVEEKEISEAFVKGICKLIMSLLPTYNDRKSRYMLMQCILDNVEKFGSMSKDIFIQLYRNQAENYADVRNSTITLSRYHLFHLEVGVNLWKRFSKLGYSLSNKEVNNFIEAIAIFFSLSTCEDSPKQTRRASNTLKEILNKTNLDLISETLVSDDLSLHKVILGGWLFDYFKGINESPSPKMKTSLIKSYVKIVLHSKKKPCHFVEEKTASLLKQINHEEFAELILPVVQKSLLRNPEVILETVGCLFRDVTLDLSRYVKDLLKVLESPLHAKEDKIREDSIFVCHQLAKQCSDQNAVEAFVKMLIDVYSGVYGKLTVNSHKISLLQAIEKVSEHCVTGNGAYTLSEDVTVKLLKVLEMETYEASLVQTITTLTVWASKFKSDIPQQLISFIPKGLTLKTTTTAVRSAYLRYLHSCVNSSTAMKFQSLVPCLLQLLDKAMSQPSQVPAVTECLAAATLLLTLTSCDMNLENQIDPIWNSALDFKKNNFVTDKFLYQASSEALIQLVSLSRLLLSNYDSKLKSNQETVEYALVWCLICSCTEVRQAAQSAIKSLVSSLGGHKLTLEFLTVMTDIVQSTKSQGKEREDGNNSGFEINCVGIVQGLTTICSVKELDLETREQLAFRMFTIVFHPLLVNHDDSLWKILCTTLMIDELKVFSDKHSEIMEMITNESTPHRKQLIIGLCLNGSTILYPSMVPIIVENIDNPLLNEVTAIEMAIFQTPEGTLFNQAVVNQAFENEMNVTNVKKLSKAYSHKEQVSMMEERKKEMEKKRKQGKLDLTPKQKEVMRSEMEKESSIRNRIEELNKKTQSSLLLLEAAIEGNTMALYPFMNTLIPALMKYLPSLLIGEQISWLFYELRKSVFTPEDEMFSSMLARTTIRIYGSSMKIPLDWRGEKESDAALRTLKELHQLTASQNDEENFLTGSGLVYSFPLLEWIMLKWTGDSKLNEKITQLGLSIIKTHTEMRAKTSVNPYHPMFLPREQLLDLLITIISTKGGRFQQTACIVLQDLCTCASGRPGCDRASHEEISILMNALTAPAQSVRDASLRGLNVLIDSLSNLNLNEKSWNLMTHRLWVSLYDVDEEIQILTRELWNKANMKTSESLVEEVLKDLTHSSSPVRSSSAIALAKLIEQENYSVDKAVSILTNIYKDNLEMTPAKKDKYDHILEEAIDHWEGRSGVGLALLHLAPLLQEDGVVALAVFFVPDALDDINENVRKDMLNAAMAVINHHGKDTINSLLPVFEKFLKSCPNKAKYDAVRQSVIVLMGSLAKHLDQSNPKIKPIVAKLVEALNTPSQQVQEAVANCLHPLVPAIKDDCPKIVEKLMKVLFESNTYGQRKGAAYGLASIVKGLGILSLKQLDIMNKLTASIQDKKRGQHREGALFAIEQLCNMLGKLFEPYIVHILPHLLMCFGDSSNYVREAAEDTAKAVMSKLSAHGVKLVLPSLLSALEEDSWRTKTGSVELLGNMAFCAPKQLSSCLPSIVPHLIEVLGDSHQKVRVAGTEALRIIGSVIRNPEIQAIVPSLLAALQDPSKNTATCLQTLLETKFVHFIDAPSLALIMPVVQRAFQDRSTEVRKMTAQIIGNMYSLTDQKDLAPYLPSIIPGLKASLLDPVPKVRSVSARALGAMVRGMGESSFDDLLPWLMQTLTSETSPVDRSGAAQGLAEVVGGLGPEKLHRLMPEIVATAERTDIAPHVKDGYIMMFIFLPTVFEEEFTPYIGQIISPILKALADENEFVRDTALRAGQRIVNTYAASAVTLLLPELENGLFHDNWRIRFSSVQLLGDLLFKVSGVSGKMTTDTAHEDDNFGTEQSQKAIIAVLGEERRNRVLAGLYMGRSDVALMVRQAALHVWKVVVTNTPKTLREILSTLFTLLLGCLASTSYDKRQVAARTLGDLVRKLGERVLPEIIPILEAGLDSPEADHRQGVCIGLSEIMASTSKDMVMCFTNNLVPTVRRALCDPLPSVREAAAHTFDSLHATVGFRALDDILPPLLAMVQDESSDKKEFALDGLKKVMAIKSRVVLPYLIPQLTATPVNTQALCILSSVAGETLTRHLHKILPALLAVLCETSETPEYEIALVHCQEVVLAVNDDMGVNIIVDELLAYSKSKDLPQCRASVALLYAFCSSTRIDYSDYAPQLIRGLIQLLVSQDQVTLQTSWNCLSAVTKSLSPTDQKALVHDVRQAVKFAAQDLKGQTLIPGFCLPKGIQPVLPIFREAVLNGEPDQKESASIGLTEVIRLTSSDALKTSVVHITGPLIRILGDRFTWNVKVAVLDTLALLLEKAGPMLKPFLPQLQTTFVKAVHDPHRGVRLKAGNALSHLIAIHTKPDPLFTELHNAIKSSEEPALRETMLQAVRAVVGPAGFRMSDTVSKGLQSTLVSLLYNEVDSIRLCAAGALGVLLQWVSEREAQSIINQYIFDDGSNNQDWRVLHGMSAALFSALKSSPSKLLEVKEEEKVWEALLRFTSSDRVNLVENGVVGVGFFILHSLLKEKDIPPKLITSFSRMVNHNSNEVKQSMCRASQYIAQEFYIKSGKKVLPAAVAKPLLPMLVNASKEKNPIVRSSAEMALIAIMKLKAEDNVSTQMLNLLEGGAKESLLEAVNKNLQKCSFSKVTENEMDMTILT